MQIENVHEYQDSWLLEIMDHPSCKAPQFGGGLNDYFWPLAAPFVYQHQSVLTSDEASDL